jgi:hypothetical protein
LLDLNLFLYKLALKFYTGLPSGSLLKGDGMRSMYYVAIVIGIVLALGESNGSLAYAKTVEAGESNSSWNGTGEVQDLGNGEQVINGIVKGVLIARHKSEAKTVISFVQTGVSGARESQQKEGLSSDRRTLHDRGA